MLLGEDIQTLNPGGGRLAVAVALLGGPDNFPVLVNFCNTVHKWPLSQWNVLTNMKVQNEVLPGLKYILTPVYSPAFTFSSIPTSFR